MTAAAVQAGGTPAGQPRGRALRRLLREPLGLVGLGLVVLMVTGAALADVVSPADPRALDLRARHAPPSLTHPLGTDHLGRDLLARVLHGGRLALQVSLSSVGLALAVGLTLGVLAGYGTPSLDHGLVLVFDAVRSFPTIMFALALVTLFGPSLTSIIVVVVVTSIPVYGRVARTQTQSIRTYEFILAARALGAGMPRVLAGHILPNVVAPLLILASMEIPVVVTIESGLSFLGVGIRPPTPTWGSILNDGYTFIRETPWPVIAGGLPLMLTTLGFTFLGEALRDVFDPRLRREA